MPVFRLSLDLFRRFQTRPSQFWRGVSIASGSFALVGLLLLRIPSPARVFAPDIVEFQDLQNVRSLTDGFVTEIFVVDGQQVDAWQPRLRLENPEVSNWYHDLRLAIEQVEVERQAALDRHEISTAQVAARKIVSLREQLPETRRDWEALTVVSPIAGQVMARSLPQKKGSFAEEGASLLSIANEESKEVLASISQSDFEFAIPCAGQPVRVYVDAPSGMVGTFVRMEPRASLDLKHPAWSATDRGPL